MTTAVHVEEGTIAVPGGHVWYKSVGDGDRASAKSDGRALTCIFEV